MVLQPFNGKDQGCICSCCGDCCAMLMSLKMNPYPAMAVKSNYFAVIDPEGCVGCEVCVSRCQIKAIHMNEDELAVVDLNRCIGCGLCVTTCTTEAASLMKKPEVDLYVPPVNLDAAHRIMEKNRGF
jgi:electron transport complex protein RnfB